MRIAQVAPLYESVPPKLYGGTERVVSYLTEELVSRGHEVTLFASGDSVTRAHLVAGSARSLRLDTSCIDPLAHHIVMLEQVFRRARNFDVVNFHVDYLHYPLSRRHSVPQVSTLHGRLDIPDLLPLYREFREMPVISISDAQRQPLPWLNWQGTVHHGVPEHLYTFRAERGSYLAFLGRISPEKRLDRAVDIARRVGMPLRIAAKVDKVDSDYFERRIRRLLDDPLVEYLGEIGETEKEELLGNAYALLFPIDWLEPFGMVTIEALACGTPVIAWPHGSVPEIVTDGETGYLVGSVDQAVEAVLRVPELSRRRCRQIFEERFTAGRMADNYLAIYELVMAAAVQPLLGAELLMAAGHRLVRHDGRGRSLMTTEAAAGAAAIVESAGRVAREETERPPLPVPLPGAGTDADRVAKAAAGENHRSGRSRVA